MDQLTVRLATSEDLVSIADLWYETRVFQQQSDSRLAVNSDSRTSWKIDAGAWLRDPRCKIWVSVRAEQITGYVIAWLHAMPAGMSPTVVGCIADMAVDLHAPSGGAGQKLLIAAQGWFTQQNINQLIVAVPHRQPVQQAFWRGQGAKAWMDLMWLKL